jgi:hypothetical protein
MAILTSYQSGCVSLSADGKGEELPKITEETPLEEAVSIAIKGGSEPLEIVKKRIKKESSADKARLATEKFIQSSLDSAPAEQMINAVHLYQYCSDEIPPQFIAMLIRADRAPVRQIGWQIAALRPSAKIRSVIEKELTLAIVENREEMVLIPDMAAAVRANSLTSVYSLLRMGLVQTGDQEFARTMIQFYPRQSSYDFMDYLALAPVEDLRQLTQKSINSQSAFVILTHFLTYPPVVNHPRYSHLFLYAISRNQALRDLANRILDAQTPQNKEQMALKLAQLPVWIQVAYVEGIRDQLTPNIRTFLTQLQQSTAHQEVLDEISSLRF